MTYNSAYLSPTALRSRPEIFERLDPVYLFNAIIIAHHLNKQKLTIFKAWSLSWSPENLEKRKY
jgi:hypothetical protein